MAKLFYDDYLNLEEVEKILKKNVKDDGAREEIYKLIDEIAHHRVLGCILDRLPEKHHKEFMGHVHERPHDEGILHYLKDKLTEDVGEFLRTETHKLSEEFLEIIHEKSDEKSSKKKK